MEIFFHWPEANLAREVKVMIGAGKRADIVAEGKDTVIVIEMKRPDKRPDNGNAGELIYYMRNLSNKLRKPCPYGLLIGNEIQIFYDNDPTKAQDEIKPSASFGFNPENPCGIVLSEVLDFNACSNEKLKEYVEETIPRIRVDPPPTNMKLIIKPAEGHRVRIVLYNDGEPNEFGPFNLGDANRWLTARDNPQRAGQILPDTWVRTEILPSKSTQGPNGRQWVVNGRGEVVHLAADCGLTISVDNDRISRALLL
jgi:hypothetical protein